jgi:predicted DNA binding CopG/RHH family protein
MKNLEIDILEDVNLLEEDFSQAEADIKEFQLDYDFQDVEDLYLNDDDSIQFWYEL